MTHDSDFILPCELGTFFTFSKGCILNGYISICTILSITSWPAKLGISISWSFQEHFANHCAIVSSCYCRWENWGHQFSSLSNQEVKDLNSGGFLLRLWAPHCSMALQVREGKIWLDNEGKSLRSHALHRNAQNHWVRTVGEKPELCRREESALTKSQKWLLLREALKERMVALK